jgi:hypothetical protein
MRAIKLTSHIGKDHRLEICLPEDVPEGAAEVIVLVPDPPQCREDNDPRLYLETFFRDLDATDRPRLTQEEIDRYLEEERVSWEP